MFKAVLIVFFMLLVAACDMNQAFNSSASPSRSLKVVIIRHGEKPIDGDNLSCQGLSRALQLPKVIVEKVGVPKVIYVPALKMGKTTTHARMLQTATPLAIENNLIINTQFDAKDKAKLANSVFKQDGVVLMVWQHSTIDDLANTLGVKQAPKWLDDDYDSIWTIQYQNGKAKLTIDKENISPQPNCRL